MKISPERLEQEATQTGFRPEILEKVMHLMHLLNHFSEDAFLSSRIALKGGTALNLFYFDSPRLSVDIDINYIGSIDREMMLQERLIVMQKIEEICLDNNYQLQRKPDEHAGGKWIFRYQSAWQGNPRLEVDLNFLTRVPLWPVYLKDSLLLGTHQATRIPLLDIHELAGGKLNALFSRHSSRDLFDAHYLLSRQDLEIEKLRLAFVVYGAMSRTDWRSIKIKNIQFEWHEFEDMLVPLLRKKDIKEKSHSKDWANQILTECQSMLSVLLPLRDNESEFLNLLLDFGEIRPELICNDPDLCKKIQVQPALIWKSIHVKKMIS